jgi:hypothetical protein
VLFISARTDSRFYGVELIICGVLASLTAFRYPSPRAAACRYAAGAQIII